jgi:hypothetical protein
MIERSEIVCFKLKPEEKEQLREATANRGITLSEAIRDALLQDDALRWSPTPAGGLRGDELQGRRQC